MTGATRLAMSTVEKLAIIDMNLQILQRGKWV
jgi:hypothetical protein